MDFAKKILNKYGWKEGDGLGKNSDGIAKPLKPNLKFDNSGLGSDQAASDFNNHWWERVFDEAASNVDVETKSDGVCMNLKNPDDSVEITTKGYSFKKLKNKVKNIDSKANGYGYSFLQSATLTKTGDTIENPNKITTDEIDVQQFKHLTDEELFKACGGRTAHKGARHGLKLSGKLSRLELQEKQLLAKMLAKTKQKEIEGEEIAAHKNKLNKEKSKKADELTLVVENDLKEKNKKRKIPDESKDATECKKSKSKIINSTNETDVFELPKKSKKKLQKIIDEEAKFKSLEIEIVPGRQKSKVNNANNKLLKNSGYEADVLELSKKKAKKLQNNNAVKNARKSDEETENITHDVKKKSKKKK